MFDIHQKDLTEKHAKKLNELLAKFEHTENLLNNLLAEHQLTEEELSAFLANPNHFEKKTWDTLQNARNQLDQKLQLELNNIKNPSATAQKYQTLKHSHQWLFVR